MNVGKPVNRPDQDDTASLTKPRMKDAGTGYPRGAVQHGLADADIKARTGSTHESVRNVPPAGKWNDVAGKEEE
jgi:hypothetical protein